MENGTSQLRIGPGWKQVSPVPKVYYIGIGGTGPGCGKDSVAETIRATLHQLVPRITVIWIPFAGQVKLEVATQYSINEFNADGTLRDKNAIIPEFGVSYRDILKYVANSVYKQYFGPHYWVSQHARLVHTHRDRQVSPIICLIPDVRFIDSEVPYIASSPNYELLFVDRDIDTALQDSTEQLTNSHPAVTEILVNNATLGDLDILARAWTKSYCERLYLINHDRKTTPCPSL